MAKCSLCLLALGKAIICDNLQHFSLVVRNHAAVCSDDIFTFHTSNIQAHMISKSWHGGANGALEAGSSSVSICSSSGSMHREVGGSEWNHNTTGESFSFF